MRFVYISTAAAAVFLAGCSDAVKNDLLFVNTSAFGASVEAPGPTTGGKLMLGQAALSAAKVPQAATAPDGEVLEVLEARREAGATGTDSWALETDSRSVFFCTGSSSLFGRDNDVGVDMIASTGNAASDAARFSRCSLGRTAGLSDAE